MSRKISDFFKLKPKSESRKLTNEQKNEEISESEPKFIKQEPHQHPQDNCLKDSKNNSKVQNLMEKVKESDDKFQPNKSKITENIKMEAEQNFVIKIPNTIDQISQNLKSTKSTQKSAKNPQKNYLKCSNLPKISNLESKNDSECKFCGKLYPDNTYIYDHVKRVHSDKLTDSLLNCNLCTASFFRKSWLILHMKNKHANDKIETFICDFDAKVFTKKKYLRCHMMKHFQKVKCKICNAELKVLCLPVHMSAVHGTEKKFPCKICDKSFKELYHLTRHEKIHDKKFECKICDKKFAHEREIKRHQKHFHEDLKTQTCDICGKMFADKANLKQHSKIHDKNRPKPFKCHRCDHATDTMQRYKKHLRCHDNQDKRFAAMKNPEKCDQCSTLCKDKFALHIHQLMVHLIITHQCDLCGKYFKNRACLRRHLHYIHLKKHKK